MPNFSLKFQLLLALAVTLLCAFFIDLPAMQAMRAVRPQWLYDFFWVITDAGKGIYWWALGGAGLALGWLRARRFSASPTLAIWSFNLLAALAAGGMLAQLLKRGLGRARPRLWESDQVYGFFGPTLQSGYDSFPSGHAQVAVAVAVLLSAYQPKYRLPAMIFAALIAVSRFITGSHYPSDIFIGLIVGYLASHWALKSRVVGNIRMILLNFLFASTTPKRS